MDRIRDRLLLTLLLLALPALAAAGSRKPADPARASRHAHDAKPAAMVTVPRDTTALQLLDARERLLDRNGDARADAIEIELDLQSPAARRVRVSGWVEVPASPVPREFVESVEPIASGTTTTRLVFDASRLHRSRVDGPYTVHLRVEGGDGAPLEQTLRTRAYRAREFEAPDLSLRPGSLRSHLVVAIGPYGSRHYRVDLPVEVREPGLFACRAVLRGDSLVAGGYTETMLESGPQVVTLDFGADARLADAPNERWQVSDCECLNGAGLPQWEPVTLAVGDSLAPSDFRDPRGEVLRADGDPTLQTVDDNQDGVFDALEYRVPVVTRAAGEVRTFASLVRDGIVIADRRQSQEVAAGRCTLTVRYPGDQIYAAGGSGALAVRGAFAFAVSRVGWPDAGLALGDAGTGPMDTERFTPAAGIAGRVLAGGRPVARSVVMLERSMTGAALTGPDGAFRLHAPQEAGRRLELRLDPRDGSRQGWRVFIDGRLVSTSGKADVILEAGRELSVSFEHD